MNNQTIHFMVGMPRSGSTVLGAILSQHPQVYCTPTSPLLDFLIGFQNAWEQNHAVIANPFPDQRTNIAKSIIDSAWTHVEKGVIIDKNRGWMRNMPASSMLFGRDVKVIATVRDLPSIMASWVSLIQQNPGSAFDRECLEVNGDITDESRCRHMWHRMVKDCAEGYQQLLRDAGERVVTIHYDDLIHSPASSMAEIHSHLGLSRWRYDFDKIESSGTRDDDLVAWGFQGMHTIRPVLNKTAQSPRDILGCNLFDMYDQLGREYGL